MVDGPSRTRPARADARRNLASLIEAARIELAADPRAGLQRIAARAGVHRATLHRHFASREDLLMQVYARYLEDVGAIIDGLDPAAPKVLVELERVTRRICEANVHWQAFRWAPAFPAEFSAPRDHMIEVLWRLFGRGRDEGVLRSDFSVLELQTAWGAPIQYLASRIADGSWTVDESVTFTLRLVRPPQRAAATP